MTEVPHIAVFRPPDERLERARDTLRSLGAEVLADPMIEPRPTGQLPRTDGAITIFTSSTAATILEETGYTVSPETTVAVIGPKTQAALEAIGVTVDIIPKEYTSEGLVAALGDRVDGKSVEIARSDHGSDALPEGLCAAGAYVHETVLYELIRPEGAGESVEATLAGDIHGLAFTSSMTVEHFFQIARERADDAAIQSALEQVVIGTIGHPTATTAEELGISVDVVPSEATFDALARAIVEHARASRSRSV